MKAHRVAIVLLAAAVSPLFGADEPPPTRSSAPTSNGTVVAADVKGSVTLTLDGATRSLKAEETVPPKARLKTATDAAVLLLFSNGASVHLGANTELAFEVFVQEPFAGSVAGEQMTEEPSVSRAVLRLAHGELAAQIKPLHGERGSSFNIATDAGVLWTQRGGATFLASASATDVVITVAEGEMNFRPTGKETMIVTAGTKLRAEVLGAELLREP